MENCGSFKSFGFIYIYRLYIYNSPITCLIKVFEVLFIFNSIYIILFLFKISHWLDVQVKEFQKFL